MANIYAECFTACLLLFMIDHLALCVNQLEDKVTALTPKIWTRI